jgi:hypothetical protein
MCHLDRVWREEYEGRGENGVIGSSNGSNEDSMIGMRTSVSLFITRGKSRVNENIYTWVSV